MSIKDSILEKEHNRRWLSFWENQDLCWLEIYVDRYGAFVAINDELVAEFTPENSPEFIIEILEELKKENLLC